MSDFVPVDHKDSDAAYRAAVREGVEERLGSRLLDIVSRDSLIGDWHLLFPSRAKAPAQTYTYLDDGTFRSPYDQPGSPHGQWKVEPGRFTEITWCKAMPEYGIDEGTWNYETYHCALTENGAVARWNGDGSLLVVLNRRLG